MHDNAVGTTLCWKNTTFTIRTPQDVIVDFVTVNITNCYFFTSTIMRNVKHLDSNNVIDSSTLNILRRTNIILKIHLQKYNITNILEIQFLTQLFLRDLMIFVWRLHI